MRLSLGFILRPFPRIKSPSYPPLQRRYTDMASTVNKVAHPFDKTRFDATLNRRFFYAPAFEIYGGRYYIDASIMQIRSSLTF